MRTIKTGLVAACLLTLINPVVGEKVTINESTFRGLRAITMENDALKLQVLPDRGANIISIYDKTTQREWAWQNPVVKYKLPKYDDSFLEYDFSGFDDGFPSVGKEKCLVFPWKNATIPDHGELWSIPWNYRAQNGALHLCVHGIRFPYRFIKEIRLADQQKFPSLILNYSVTNLSPMDLPMVWCGHYIVAIKPGMKAFFPRDVRFAGDTKQWRPEVHDRLAWITFGGPETQAAAKFFTQPLSEGFTGFYDPATKDFLLYTFPTAQMPRLGVYIDQGGFPTPDPRFYHAGLEPTNGLESPAETQKAGGLRYLKANCTLIWQIKLTFGKADPKSLDMTVHTLSR